ncbi:MAG: hypothetical protein II966_08500 [Lachnospiraceae bacterium]|nr:hypothetical protein [Lachnospiraceae bacterium]
MQNPGASAGGFIVSEIIYFAYYKRLTGEEGELDRLIKASDSMMYEMKRNRDSHRRS